MDADYRQYSKPKGNGCLVPAIILLVLFLGVGFMATLSHLTGLDPVEPGNLSTILIVDAIKLVVIALVLAFAIVRLRRKRSLLKN